MQEWSAAQYMRRLLWARNTDAFAAEVARLDAMTDVSEDDSGSREV